MKNILFIAIAVLISTGAVQAQHINIGIKGGSSAYTIFTDNNKEINPILGYNAGLLGHMHINSSFAFQPEAVYSMQGTNYDISGIENTLKLNYINIPLNLQYMFDNGFRIQAGPQLGVLTSAKLEIGNNVTDRKSSYRSTDIGVTVGISYVKPSTGFGIDLRYNHGLTNINSTDAIKSYNRGVQFGVFYLFQHKS